jgi:ribosomal protein L9
LHEVLAVSIVRIGLAETKKFAEGYSAIFGNKKKKAEQEKPANQETQAKQEAEKNAKAGKKNGKK